MRIVGIGGGTGLPVLLSGLKELSEEQPLDITAIVTVADSGGSTGVLRDAFKMPAMGDIRKCMIALAAEEAVLASVCEHRFDNPDGFAGHSLGNLILSALYQMSGSFNEAVRQACELLCLKGRVLPATARPVTLCAVYEDGGMACGESNIPQPGRRIQRVWLQAAAVGAHPYNPPAAPGVIEALEGAEGIVIAPGSLYTSLIPNLLVAGVPEAIRTSNAIKIFVSNLMTQPGETDGFSAADHIGALLEYTSIDVCVLNSSAVGMGVAQRYSKSGSEIVSGTSEDEDEIRRKGVIPIAAPLLKTGEVKARHDPATLARLVVSLARGFAGAHEIMCGERNGR
ncbi:MAG TPA: gluconeogenesis factor YvcK family protein [Terriglobia bacterium]|nr:gluconeogenesis factor YvcK family protein [Terriglobia bacterium]